MLMKTPLHVFEEEFLDYCINCMPFDSLSFGNMDFDFVLEKIDNQWMLFVYEVCIDHYGMPYRNMLDYRLYNVDRYFD